MLITRHELELHRIVVDRVFEPGVLDFHDSEFRQIESLTTQAVAELLGDEILIRGTLRTRIEAPCDRCLKLVPIEIVRDFDLIYRPLSTIAREEEIELPEGELDVGFYEEAGIELADVLAEQVNLALPMKLVCREDCLGLCPTCGADRNAGTCQCPPPPSSSPFAVLR
jgi:uncharacterized protein